MDPEQIPLKGLHLPEAIGWWPPAPGWWVLIGVALIGLGFLLRHWMRTRSRSAARRYALRQLKVIVHEYEQHKDAVAFAANVSELLRRTMLAYAPRQNVAGLTGEEWLAWLDQDLAQPVFGSGPGRQLLDLPYRNPNLDIPVADMDRLVAAIRHRMATPVGVPR